MGHPNRRHSSCCFLLFGEFQGSISSCGINLCCCSQEATRGGSVASAGHAHCCPCCCWACCTACPGCWSLGSWGKATPLATCPAAEARHTMTSACASAPGSPNDLFTRFRCLSWLSCTSADRSLTKSWVSLAGTRTISTGPSSGPRRRTHGTCTARSNMEVTM